MSVIKLFMTVCRKYKQEGLHYVVKTALRRICTRKDGLLNRFWLRYHENYLRKNYGYVIEKYKNFVPPQDNESDSLRGIIWTMWWQGEENCPDIVKLCLASMRKHCAGHKIIIITKDNFQEYIDVPEYLLRKFHDGLISLTHLSDIFRAMLLEKHGGLWLDSTILTAGEIPEKIFEADYYTVKHMERYSEKRLHDRWTVYLWSAKKHSILPSFISEMWLEYWKKNDSLLEYFLMDYAIAVAFDDLPEFRALWERVPMNTLNRSSLTPRLNDEYDPAEFARLCEDNIFFKLTRKVPFRRKTEQGRETFYGHLLAEYGID